MKAHLKHGFIHLNNQTYKYILYYLTLSVFT